MELQELKPIEITRTYHFSNGGKVKLEQVTHFLATDDTHRLKTADGKLHIVPREGWQHVEIEAEAFTL